MARCRRSCGFNWHQLQHLASVLLLIVFMFSHPALIALVNICKDDVIPIALVNICKGGVIPIDLVNICKDGVIHIVRMAYTYSFNEYL